MRERRLQWLPELGIGFLDPGVANIYDDSYFEHYATIADTDIGRRLNTARVQMLERHWHGHAGVVDIGIGAGTFVEAVPGIHGYDINPRGVVWLLERDLYHDPHIDPVDVACMWDALEHVLDPTPLLNAVRHRILVSLPIFRDVDHVMSSKHLKPGEHIWYWTERGFIWFMAEHGWKLIEANEQETKIGREDINSYAFARV